MIIRNSAELTHALTQEIAKAMNELADESREIVDRELAGYYTGSPKMYQRTGHLAQDGDVTPPSGTTEQSFLARLKNDYSYPSITYTYPDGGQTTSKSPTMGDILKLTNDGQTSSSVGKLHPAIGRRGYWQRIEDGIRQAQDRIMAQHFH